MTFTKFDLEDEVHETISLIITRTSRWSVHYDRVFSHEGRFYRTRYRRGLSDEGEIPYEHDDDQIECPEVFPKQVTVTVYEER